MSFAAPSSTSASSSSSHIEATQQLQQQQTAQQAASGDRMDDEQGEFLAEDEAVQVIETDDAGDGTMMEGDDEMMGDGTGGIGAGMEDEELTEEELKQREADLHKTAQLAKDLRTMLDDDDSKQGFFEHKDSVFAVGLSKHHPDWAFSGDGDDQAYVWQISSGDKKFHLAGHTDSVIDGGFSNDGRFVATASMDATVRVYNVADGSLRHSLEGPSKEFEWMSWHPAGPVIIAGSVDETVWMWNAESGECMSVFSGHSGSVTCGAWTLDGKAFVSCDESGGLIAWNPKTGEMTLHLKDVHDGPITSFAMHPDKTQRLCITGGHDGIVKVLSLDSGKVLAHFKNLHADSVEGVQFAPKLKLAASCSVDGKIKVLDLTNGQVRVTCAHEDAVTHIAWAENEPLLYSSSVDKTLKLWDARSGQCLQTWKGHSDAVMTFAVSEDGSTIVSGSDDHTALVFKRSS